MPPPLRAQYCSGPHSNNHYWHGSQLLRRRHQLIWAKPCYLRVQVMRGSDFEQMTCFAYHRLVVCARLKKQSLGAYMNHPIIGIWGTKPTPRLTLSTTTKTMTTNHHPTTTTTTSKWQWNHQRCLQISWESETADAHIEMHHIPFEPCLELSTDTSGLWANRVGFHGMEFGGI